MERALEEEVVVVEQSLTLGDDGPAIEAPTTSLVPDHHDQQGEEEGGNGLYPPPRSPTSTCSSMNGPSAFSIVQKRFRLQAPPCKNRKRPPPRTLPPPCLHEAVDFLLHPSSSSSDTTIIPVEGCHWTPQALRVLGYQGDSSSTIGQPKAYQLVDREGFYFISQALSPQVQAVWARRCVEEWSRVPHNNLTNLHGDNPPPHMNLNDLWGQAIQQGNIDGPIKSLRWSCLGRRYNWSTKSYYEEPNGCCGQEATITSDVRELVAAVVESVGLGPMEPHAGIVNYYPIEATMGGHVDDAEGPCLQPLVSFSVGLSGVFLLGGPTRDTPPIPLLMRSGDALIMSGPSRLCYHGVPCILPGTCPPALSSILRDHSGVENDKGGEEDQESHLLAEYLETHRLNFNLRQIHL